jgi:hypothetical protein
MKINDEGTSNAAHWHERAMKAESQLAEAEALLREALPSVQSHIRKHRRSWEAAMKRGDEFHTRKHCEQMNKDLALESRIDAHLARKP